MNRRTVVELAARWYVFFFLNVYGLGKIIGGQFYRRGRMPDDVAAMTLGNAPAFELAWTFMGYSYTYILFIGLAEMIGAFLLLWNRTKLIGVAILLPVMANILVFDVIFLDKYGALASATIYTVLLLVIVGLNKDRVVQAVRELTRPADEARSRRPGWQTVVAALVLFGIVFAIDQALVNVFGHGKG